MSARELHAELLNLRNTTGGLLYKRLVLARSLLADRDWVEDRSGGGGAYNIAVDRLEDDCFADVCGALSLPQMLQVLDAVPQETTWRKAKYNLRTLWAEMKARQAPREKRETTKTPELTREERKIASLEERVSAKELTIGELKDELAQARKRIGELEKENKQLRNRLDHIAKAMSIANAS